MIARRGCFSALPDLCRNMKGPVSGTKAPRRRSTCFCRPNLIRLLYYYVVYFNLSSLSSWTFSTRCQPILTHSTSLVSSLTAYENFTDESTLVSISYCVLFFVHHQAPRLLESIFPAEAHRTDSVRRGSLCSYRCNLRHDANRIILP
jgi:hypothetical protein